MLFDLKTDIQSKLLSSFAKIKFVKYGFLGFLLPKVSNNLWNITKLHLCITLQGFSDTLIKISQQYCKIIYIIILPKKCTGFKISYVNKCFCKKRKLFDLAKRVLSLLASLVLTFSPCGALFLQSSFPVGLFSA